MGSLYLLPTDYCWFGLLLLALFYSFWARHQHIHRTAWTHVISHRLTLIALILLGCMALITTLDSIHFMGTKPPLTGQIYSLIDQSLYTLTSPETTYSQPFATHLFQTSTLTQSLSSNTLKHIAPFQNTGDVLKALYTILGLTGLVMAVLSGFIGFWKYRSTDADLNIFLKIWRMPIMPLLTLFFLLIISSLVLSQHYHILGTDQVGHDVFYQCIKSIRTGLLIGSLTTCFILPCALILGLSAGFFGGLIDDLIQLIYTTLSAIPGVLLISTAVLTLQVLMSTHADRFASMVERADVRLLALCFILGLNGWTPLARLLRAEALKLREMAYIDAAWLMGLKRIQIIFKHIVPNVMHLVLMTMILDFSGLVLAEAVLSYVGVGVDPTTYSWGNMINAARLELARSPVVWWPLSSAFFFMLLLVWSANSVADRLRLSLNPYSTD